jgi:transcriptional regulator with XRE-family HTH domain
LAHLRSRSHRELQSLLVELRKTTGLTQIRFADELGWQKSVVERIEAGHQIPTYLEAVEWARACGVTAIGLSYRYTARLRRGA